MDQGTSHRTGASRRVFLAGAAAGMTMGVAALLAACGDAVTAATSSRSAATAPAAGAGQSITTAARSTTSASTAATTASSAEVSSTAAPATSAAVKTAVQSPEGQVAAQFIVDRYQRVAPPGTKGLPAAPSGVTQFTLGRQVMSWGGPSILQNVAIKAADEVTNVLVGKPVIAGGATYRAPVPSKVRPIAESFTDWLIITTQSKHSDDAFDVLKVILSGKDLLDYNEQFYYIPPRKSVASQGFMAQPKNQEVVKIFSQYGAGAASPIVPDSARFRDLMNKALSDIANKQIGIQDGLTQVATAYDPVIASSGWAEGQ